MHIRNDNSLTNLSKLRFQDRARPMSVRPDAILSRIDYRRIVAEILG